MSLFAGKNRAMQRSGAKLPLLKSVAARAERRSSGAIRSTSAAWSDGTPIKGVGVKIDDEAWKPAQLTPNRDPFARTFWTFDGAGAKPGDHTIVSRATGAQRQGPTRARRPFVTLKRTRWENNQQAVRKLHLEG
jgi:hypothetical protein